MVIILDISLFSTDNFVEIFLRSHGDDRKADETGRLSIISNKPECTVGQYNGIKLQIYRL